MNDLELIKKHYGEQMSHACREWFPTILNMPGELFKILSSEFAYSRFLYEDLIKDMTALNSFKGIIINRFIKDNKIEIQTVSEKPVTETPKELFELAGYDFYECKTVDDVKQFEKYYRFDEKLCTFRDIKGRLERCYVFWVVKKNADEIKREDFKVTTREDQYSTSVMSIQFPKYGPPAVSIKSRYNHTVPNPDSVYGNNLDKIRRGLSESFKKTYNLSVSEKFIEDNFVLDDYTKTADGKRFKFNCEDDAIYYCPNNIVIKDGKAMQYDTSQYLIIDNYIIDFKNKIITRGDDKQDGFIESIGKINRIEVLNGKENNTKQIIINNDILIVVNNKNQIISYTNEHVIEVKDSFLDKNVHLEELKMPNVEIINDDFLTRNKDLREFNFPKLIRVKYNCLRHNQKIKKLICPELIEIGNNFMFNNTIIDEVYLPKVVYISANFLGENLALTTIDLPNVSYIGNDFLGENIQLSSISLPKVKDVGMGFLGANLGLREIKLPEAREIHSNFLERNEDLEIFEAPNVESIGHDFLHSNKNLRDLVFPKLTFIRGEGALEYNKELITLYMPNIDSISYFYLTRNNKNKHLRKIIDTPHKLSHKITDFMRKLLDRNEKLKLVDTKEIEIKEESKTI